MPTNKKQRVVIYSPEELLTLLCALAKVDPLKSRGAFQSDGSYAVVVELTTEEGE